MKLFLIVLALFSSVANADLRTIVLSPSNTITLRGAVDDRSVSKAQSEFIELLKKRGANTPIYIVLDTPGGSVVAGESLIEFLSGFSNVHTITIFAASMGSSIVQALPGKRLMLRNGVQMFHRASIGMPPTEMEKVKSILDFYMQMVRDMEERSSKRIGISLPVYQAKVADEWWLTAKQAIKENVADEIVKVRCTPSLINKAEEVEYQTFFGSVVITYSGCPLLQFALPKGK